MADPNKIIELLPLHAVEDGGLPRPRGRPKKVEPKPSRADLEHHAQVAQQQAERVEADDVVRAVVDGCDPQEVLRRASEALARLAAVLEQKRVQLELRGRDVGQLVSRKANVLMMLTQLQIKLRDLDPQVLDLHGQAFAQVFKIWVQDLARVAQQVLPPEQFDVLMIAMENELVGWEDRVEAMLR